MHHARKHTGEAAALMGLHQHSKVIVGSQIKRKKEKTKNVVPGHLRATAGWRRTQSKNAGKKRATRI
jgi:hypothetical protein